MQQRAYRPLSHLREVDEHIVEVVLFEREELAVLHRVHVCRAALAREHERHLAEEGALREVRHHLGEEHDLDLAALDEVWCDVRFAATDSNSKATWFGIQ